MEQNSLSINANSAATLLSGFAGVILTFVNNAIQGNVKGITYQDMKKVVCKNVQV